MDNKNGDKYRIANCLQRSFIYKLDVYNSKTEIKDVHDWLNIVRVNAEKYPFFAKCHWCWKSISQTHPSAVHYDMGLPISADLMKKYAKSGRYTHFTNVTTVPDTN